MYLKGIIDGKIRPEKIESAQAKINELLDQSVIIAEDARKYTINESGRELDLSKMDVDELREQFKRLRNKNLAISDLRELIEEKLKKMLAVFIVQNGASSERFFQLAKVLLFLKSNSTAFESKFKFLYISVQDMFYQVIEQGQKTGEIKKCDSESMTTAIFGLAQSIILQTYLNSQSNNNNYFEAISIMIDGIKGEN